MHRWHNLDVSIKTAKELYITHIHDKHLVNIFRPETIKKNWGDQFFIFT